MKAPLIHVAGLIFNEPLAIMPTKLEAILRAIGPRLVVDDTSLDELVRLRSINSRPALMDDAVMFDAQVPRQSEGEEKPYRLTPEGVAVIPVRGTLLKRFGFLSAASGFTSYSGLQQAAAQALGDPQVKAVMFDIDSPGGTTHGCFELSDAIYQMRGEKPMWACANDLAASAAYAIASATDRIFVTRTAGVGSVGVFALHAEQSGLDEQAGVVYTYVYAGEKKVDGNPHEPLSKSARADIQAEVDREHMMFISTVARNRAVSLDRIYGTRAGVLFAQNALPLLADEVSTYDEALGALTERVSGSRMLQAPGKVASMPAMDEPKGVAVMPKTSEEMKRAKADDDEELKAAAAAAPKDDEDEDDMDDAEEKEAAKSKAKVKAEDDGQARRGAVAEIPTRANSAAKRIVELCQIAGAPELAADYIGKDYSVDKVIDKLSARRSKASAENSVSSFVPGDAGASAGSGNGPVSVDAAIDQARIMAANSGGKLKQSQCFAQLMRQNPEIYNGYLEEKNQVAAKIMFSGGGRALNEYVLGQQRRYMSKLGLSTAIEDVPTPRPM